MEFFIGYPSMSTSPLPPPTLPFSQSINLQLRVESFFEEMSRYFVIFISDVDECSQDATPCSANEECLNEQGSYSCYCQLGYRKENKVCVKKGEQLKIKLSTIEQQSTSGFHTPALVSIINFLFTLSNQLWILEETTEQICRLR